MTIRIYAIGRDGVLREPSATELPTLLEDIETHLWVCLQEADETSRHLLKETFRLHDLLVEDVLDAAPTPKLELHEGLLYAIVHGLHAGGPETVDVDFMLWERLLVTHHRVPIPSLEGVQRELAAEPALLARGPVFVMHRLIDRMVDEYLPLMAQLDKVVGEIEESVVRDPEPVLLERILELKHTLQRLYRVGLHQRGVLQRIADGALPFVPSESQPFFRDVLDHHVQAIDLNEHYREIAGASMDAYLSMQSHRLNEVMKTLTVISTVMLPLTFITGLYGMNFEHMPLIHWRYGYETAWVAMIFITLFGWIFMKRRRWL